MGLDQYEAQLVESINQSSSDLVSNLNDCLTKVLQMAIQNVENLEKSVVTQIQFLRKELTTTHDDSFRNKRGNLKDESNTFSNTNISIGRYTKANSFNGIEFQAKEEIDHDVVDME